MEREGKLTWYHARLESNIGLVGHNLVINYTSPVGIIQDQSYNLKPKGVYQTLLFLG